MSVVSEYRTGSAPPLIAHVVHGLCAGGLERKLVTVLNSLPEDRFRHVIICMTDEIDGLMHELRPDIPVLCVNKRRGHDPAAYLRLTKMLIELRPTVLHTRNIGTVEAQLAGVAARVPARIHGVHGRDIKDPDGTNPRYLFVHRTLRPFIHRFVAVSRDLASWVTKSIHVAAEDVEYIPNGVDTRDFRPAERTQPRIGPPGFTREDSFVIGAVGRFRRIKDYPTVARAFVCLTQQRPDLRDRVRLVLVGSGETAEETQRILQEGGCGDIAWMAGPRRDIADVMRSFDLYVLPSIGEGMSNTVLEAMATGLPVVATRVGGNPYLVEEGSTGRLVRAGDSRAMAEALLAYIDNRSLARDDGARGRARVEAEFALSRMIDRYLMLYDAILRRRVQPYPGRVVAPSREAEQPSAPGALDRVKRVSFIVLQKTGINAAFRATLRKDLLALCYHGVIPEERRDQAFICRNAVSAAEFRRQLEFLTRRLRPISIENLLDCAREGADLPKNAVLVTFDDGYRNNYLHAAPILREYGVPAAIFVATSYIGRSANLWANEIDFRILNWADGAFPLPGGKRIPLPKGRDARQELTSRVRQLCKRLPEEALRDYLAVVCGHEDSGADNLRRELFEFMSWDEARELQRQGIYIGSHTVSHPILTRITPARLRQELADSRREIEERLGLPCECLAYPNGEVTDFSHEVMSVADASGYRLGFSLTGERARVRFKPLAIPRVTVPGHVEPLVFESVVSGVYRWMRRTSV